jgi:alkylation response protein AidB-like acyl-CoA dehydrogenase
MLRNVFKVASKAAVPSRRLAGIPIDDTLFGLTDDQIELRTMCRNFFEAELEPHADEADRTDVFKDFRKFWLQCGEMGLHGITSPEEYIRMPSGRPGQEFSHGAYVSLCGRRKRGILINIRER